MATTYFTEEFTGVTIADCITLANTFLSDNPTWVLLDVSVVMISGNSFSLVIGYSKP